MRLGPPRGLPLPPSPFPPGCNPTTEQALAKMRAWRDYAAEVIAWTGARREALANDLRFWQTLAVVTFIAFLAALAGGCSAADAAPLVPVVERPPPLRTIAAQQLSAMDAVIVVRDDARGVTCWIFDGYQQGGIECLRDEPAAPTTRRSR